MCLEKSYMYFSLIIDLSNSKAFEISCAFTNGIRVSHVQTMAFLIYKQYVTFK